MIAYGEESAVPVTVSYTAKSSAAAAPPSVSVIDWSAAEDVTPLVTLDRDSRGAALGNFFRRHGAIQARSNDVHVHRRPTNNEATDFFRSTP